MKWWTLAASLGALGVLAVVTLLLAVRPPRAAPTRARANEAGVAELERTLGRMQQRLEELERAALRPAPAPSASAARKPHRMPPLTEEDRRERAVQQTRALEELSAREPRDPSWAPGYEVELRKGIESTPGAGETTELSCRGSLCRFEVRHTASRDQAQFTQELQSTMPPHAAYRLTPHEREDGTWATEVYVIRQGYPIPGMR